MKNSITSPAHILSLLQTALGGQIVNASTALDEVTIDIKAADYLSSALVLRDNSQCRFQQLIDLCGVDFSQYRDGEYEGKRFCVVLHLLSVTLNQRLRVRVFCEDDNMPCIDSVCSVWNSADWFEREAFDLYGIVFMGHADLRRILTDYGFIGHPFRKDFPVEGNVEMRYDAEEARVVYQPVTIEPREITPRIIREDGYGGL